MKYIILGLGGFGLLALLTCWISYKPEVPDPEEEIGK
jgi:hypothetical protein